jgi:hypothetical protein
MSTIGSIHPFATSTSFSGTLTTTQGGTGLSCPPSNALLLGNGCEPLATIAPATNGQTIIGVTGGAPVFNTITAGSGITVTNGPGTITISSTAGSSTTFDGNTGSATPNGSNILNIVGQGAISTLGSGNTIAIDVTGGGTPWVDVTMASITMSTNTGYISDDSSSVVSLTLPSGAAFFGDTLYVTGGVNGIGWTIAQNTGQQIYFDSSNTTAGTSGSISSTDPKDSVRLVCIAEGTTSIWNVISAIGNLTIV